MKKIKLTAIITTLIMLVLAACEKSELSSDEVIEGTYVGTITNIDVLGRTTAKNGEDAIAEITKIGNETIQVHFNSVEVDTTFMLNYYINMDSVMVCFTGVDFENMYGHMLGQGHNGGGMMDDIQNNETEWIHHLNDEHQQSDEHFGGFDMQNHSFGYHFNKSEGGVTHDLIFQGKK